MTTIKIGQTVETAAGQQGIVRYVGPIHFAQGTYVGIELPSAAGKNDGSVRGERYFTCPVDHGLFVKSTGNLRVVPPPLPAVAPATASTSQIASAAPRARPTSVVAPRPQPRSSIIDRRQSLATSSQTSSRAPVRTPSSGVPSVGNVETLQTKIRHLEKQHSEDQDRLRELSQAKDERDRFQKLLDKLQTKCQAQHAELLELKENLRNTQLENENLTRSNQEHELNLENAIVDKEMAEERAEAAETEFEQLRYQLQERDAELEILRDEAELYTTEMTEEERQNAGYYRLQQDNDRIRQALLSLKEMTEEKERDLKTRITSLESDLTNLEHYEHDNATLQQRVTEADAVIEDLKQRLDAATEVEEMIGEISSQNHDLQDRIAEQELHIQDLENLRELNDELEVQHLETEDELRAEVEVRDIELAEQARNITEQTAIIADNETLISKFRELVLDLQGRATDAESSKTMTEAVVKNTTGKFNQIMDINRQLRNATVQSTARKIDHDLARMDYLQASRESNLWSDDVSGEFIRGEPNQAYLTTQRLEAKAEILMEVLHTTQKEMSNGGRLDDTFAELNCWEAITLLKSIHNGNRRLYYAMRHTSLAQFSTMGSNYQDLLTIEHVLDEVISAVKADTVQFDTLPVSLVRSNEIYDAVLMNQQEALLTRPENEALARAQSYDVRLRFMMASFGILASALEKVPDGIHAAIGDLQKTIKQQTEMVGVAATRADKFAKTLESLRADGLFCQFGPDDLEELIEFDEKLINAANETHDFARNLIGEIILCSTSTASESISTDVVRDAGMSIFKLQIAQSEMPWTSQIGLLSGSLDIWITQASSLLYCVEIPSGPTPWAQKAKLREAAQKLSQELGVQLDAVRKEQHASLLKIHEREEIIATKNLEIEHLLARNRDAAAKAEALDALRGQIAEKDAKIVLLNDEVLASRARIIEICNEDYDDKFEARVVQDPLPEYADPVSDPLAPLSAPPGMRVMLEALENENHWLRQRCYLEQYENNLKDYFEKLGATSPRTYYQPSLAMQLDDFSDDEEETTPLSSSPAASTSAPVGLKAVGVSVDSMQRHLKEVIEARAHLDLATIEEEDEGVFV